MVDEFRSFHGVGNLNCGRRDYDVVYCRRWTGLLSVEDSSRWRWWQNYRIRLVY